jgi:hypothetical protein
MVQVSGDEPITQTVERVQQTEAIWTPRYPNHDHLIGADARFAPQDLGDTRF